MLGKKGYSGISLKEFKKNFLDRHYLSFSKESRTDADGKPTQRKRERIRVDIYLYDDEYYKLGVFCIKNKLSRGEFAKKAILDRMNLVLKEKKLQKKQMKNGSLI